MTIAHSALSTAQHELWVFGDRIAKICREYVEIAARQGSFATATREILVELVGIGEQRFIDDGKAHQLKFSIND